MFTEFISLSPVQLAIFSIFFISWLIQIRFLLVRVRPLAFFKPCYDEVSNSKRPVSVIICAKNEAENLQKFLPLILTQNYPNYEVVVVNDCSEDDSELILAGLKEKYSHLYYTNIPIDRKFRHGKKLALTIGIKAARNEYLVLTDADCYPRSEHWLSEMMKGFNNSERDIVLGVGCYKKERGFTNLLTRYDTFFTAIQYLGFALSGNPYMGVGRNLAYKKKLFVKNNGFRNHSHILSGDDDLFVHEVANKNNVSIVIRPNAQTLSIAPESLKQWKNQKSRHLSTAPYYKFNIKTELISESLSRQLLIYLGIILIIINTFVIFTAVTIIIKYLIQFFFWKRISKKLSQKRFELKMFIFDIIHPWFLLWAYSAYFFSRNRNKWK